MSVAQPGSKVARYFGMARQVLGQGQAFEAQGDLDRVRMHACSDHVNNRCKADMMDMLPTAGCVLIDATRPYLTTFPTQTQPNTTSNPPNSEQAYIFYKRFLRLSLDCIPAHPEYRHAGADKAWLATERRTALAALEKVSAALDREFGGPADVVVAPAPATAAAPPSQSKEAPKPGAAAASGNVEADLERRLRALRGGDGGAGASATRLLVSSPLLDDEEEDGGTQAPSTITMPEPSAPPLFDDGPLLAAGTEQSSSNPAAVVDFDTAFRALRASEDDGAGKGGGGLKYYPALPASPAPAPAKPPPAAVGGVGGRFAARGQLRPLVLASGLIGKFLEIAEPNSRKVRQSGRKEG